MHSNGKSQHFWFKFPKVSQAMFNLPPPPFGLDDDQKPVVRGEGRGCWSFQIHCCIIRGKMMMMMMALTKWMLYDNQIKYLLIIILCTCFELLEKQMSWRFLCQRSPQRTAYYNHRRESWQAKYPLKCPPPPFGLDDNKKKN